MSPSASFVFVLPDFSGGGAERVSLNLLNYLYRCGYSVQLIVLNDKGELKSEVCFGIPVHITTYSKTTIIKAKDDLFHSWLR